MEFQPVVFAGGRGSRMTDLTSHVPKALLPIGNRPMVWYPLKTLEKAGFEDAIVIVLDSFYMTAVNELCDLKMKLDIVKIPEQEYLGTADALRYIRDKIKRDLLLVSCDLITDISLHNLANIYRTHDATVTMLLCSAGEQTLDTPVPGPKFKKRSERDFFGFDAKGSRVLFMTSEADLADAEDDKVRFRRSVLKKHPNMNIRSNLTDCHMYLMKKWVVDYLADNKQISSIKGELIPHLVKKQFTKRKKVEGSKFDESVKSEELKSDIYSYIPENEMTSRVQEMSTWIDHSGDMEDCYHGDKIRCYSYVHTGGLCVRTNTVATYFETNKQIPRVLMTMNKDMTTVDPSAEVKGKSQVGSDCLLGAQSSVGDKVSVKHSVIGAHCTIGDKVKITNSVIHDKVKVAEGCSIQGCILGLGAKVEEKCELKDCIVGSGQSLSANSKFTNEAIVEDEEMMEI